MNNLELEKQKAFCHKLVKKYADYERKEFEDRNVLEEIIFPYILAYHNPGTILDIGREDYQHFYNYFFEGKILWTIDNDKKHAKYGAKNHIIDGVENLEQHFKEKNYFDFILMNGVFGWGLNEENKIEQTINSIYNLLSKNGVFVMGWNDIPELKPMDLEKIKALKKFKAYNFPPLKSSQFKCINGEHTYNFFIKN